MQIGRKLAALAVAGSAAALTLTATPAGAATHPSWVGGREVIAGTLYGKAAWRQAMKADSKVPVKFRGVVKTHANIGLGGGKSRTHSVWTPAGWFTVRLSHQRTRARVMNQASCRLRYQITATAMVRPRKSTGVFAGATGRGRLRIRFTFDYPKRANGTCDFSGKAAPKKHGGLISFRLVIPHLWVR